MKDQLSWWEYEHYLRDVDFTIVGAGIVGISTAIEIKTVHPDAKVLILDKKNTPIGASTKNAGFACFGSISEILDDCDLYGEQVSEKLIKMRWEGLTILKNRFSKKSIGYSAYPGAEIFQNENIGLEYVDQLGKVNEIVAPIVGDDTCFSVKEGPYGMEIVNKYEGALNPQLMMFELESIARDNGIRFLFGVGVDEICIEKSRLQTSHGNLEYKNLIICTNGFSKSLLPEHDVLPARNQVLITNAIDNFQLDQCYHMNKGYVYFRSYDQRLLIGGGRHLDKKGETTDVLGSNELIKSYLIELLDNYILKEHSYTIAHEWSGILGVGKDKMPIVKKISDNVTIAVRMGGMGVAIGSLIGKITSAKLFSIDNSAHRLYVS